jgi:uncharacterized protein (TIGR02453 family)
MSYFNPAFVKFFKELSTSNTKEWFDANRKTYETEVKQPFAAFVEEMISRIAKHEPEITIKPADAISRINKDIRFSKDKTPYNTHLSANISKYGKKDKSYPGFYFQLSPEKVEVFGGVYMAEPPQLEKIRKQIAKDPAGFKAAYSDKKFTTAYGTLQGEQQKRLPEEFKDLAAKEPLIAYKQFYYTASLPAKLITSPELADKLMDFYIAARKVNEYLRKAF